MSVSAENYDLNYSIPPFTPLNNNADTNMFKVKSSKTQKFFLNYENNCEKSLIGNLPTEIVVDTNISPISFIHLSRNGAFHASAQTDKPVDGTGEHAMA